MTNHRIVRVSGGWVAQVKYLFYEMDSRLHWFKSPSPLPREGWVGLDFDLERVLSTRDQLRFCVCYSQQEALGRISSWQEEQAKKKLLDASLNVDMEALK